MKRLLNLSLLLLGTFAVHIGHTQPVYAPITLDNVTQLVQVARLGNGGVRQMTFSPDETHLAVATTLGVWVIDLTESSDGQTLFEGQGGAWSVAFSPDGTRVAGGGDDGSVMVWNAETGETVARLENHLYPISALAWSPGGGLIASGDWSGIVRVWDVAARNEYRVFESTERIERLTFAGAWLIALSDRTRTTWEILRHVFLSQTEHSEDLGNNAEISTGERRAVWGSISGVIEIWDNSEQIALLEGFHDARDSVFFSNDGQVHTGSGEALDALLSAQPVISPNGEIEATFGNDGIIRLLDASTGDQIAALYGHIRKVNAVAYSPDGNLLVSASDDGTIQVWDATVTEESGSLMTLDGHTSGVTDVAFNADGTLIASTGYDGTVRFWGIPA